MNYLLPMAGKGERFLAGGYTLPKPLLPIVDYHTGNEVPMVLAAAKDFPNISATSNIVFIDRDLHKSYGIHDVIRKDFHHAYFLTLAELTEGTVPTCLRAEHLINLEEELFIGSCDSGMMYSLRLFNEAKKNVDVLIFTHRNHEAAVVHPECYGWVRTDRLDNVLNVSVKKPISDQPLNDHVVAASFWYRKASFFFESAKNMITALDKVNNEYYVDQSINYCLRGGLKVKVFEVDKFFNWGSPEDYENYQKTIKYWQRFNEQFKP